MTRLRGIVLFVADQHAARYAGYAGHEVVRTPCLDAIRRDGMDLPVAYCQSPLCVPSRLSFLSGRFPHELRAWGNGRTFAPDAATLPRVLSAAGYHSSGLGKLHFRDGGKHGFDSRPVGDAGSDVDHRLHLDRAIRELGLTPPGQHPSEAREAPWPAEAEQESIITATAIEVLRRRHRSPFFLMIGYPKPHFPYVATRGYLERYRGRGTSPSLPPSERPDNPASSLALIEKHGLANVSDAQCRAAREAYWANVSFVDDCVARVMAELSDLSVLDDTLVVYVSDHGDMLGERGLWYKSCFFEDAVRVPWLMRLPGVIPAGSTWNAPVGLVDLYPTILQLAGVRIDPRAVSGASLFDERPRSDPADRPVFSEYYGQPLRIAQRMVRAGRWKYWWSEGEPDRLHDLTADPLEKTNLAGSFEHADRRAALAETTLAGWDVESFRRYREWKMAQ